MDSVDMSGNSLHNAHGQQYTIAELAQIGKQLGEVTRLHVGNVYSTNPDGPRLRRSEITITRDMEFVRIYDTKTARIIASFPETAPYFHLCPPHCLIIKQKDGRMKRLLWQALSSRARQDEDGEPLDLPVSHALISGQRLEGRWLKCQSEYVNPDGSTTPETPQPGSLEMLDDVVCLESVILDGKGFLLAGYRSGLLAAHTADLKISNSPLADSMMGETILSMTTLNTSRAKDGLLKTVSSVIPMMNSSRILAIISRPTGISGREKLRIRVLQLHLKDSSPDRPIGTVLMTLEITPDSALGSKLNCSIHEKGQLYLWGKKSVQVWDLSQGSNQNRTLQFDNYVTSTLRVDQTSMFVCTIATLEHVNLEYSRTQTSVTWPEPLHLSAVTKNYDSHLISYDRKAGRLLCLHGAKVLAITYNQNKKWSLADFVDQGLNSSVTSMQYKSEAHGEYLAQNFRGELQWEEWPSVVSTLAACAQSNDKPGFDRTFKTLLVWITEDESISDLNKITLSPSEQLNNDEKLSLVLNCVFQSIYQEDTADYVLAIKFLPRQAYHWLVRNGYFTAGMIEHAFRRLRKLGCSEHIRETSIIHALVKHDSSLNALEYLVVNSNILTAVEAAAAIHIVFKYQDATPNGMLGITTGDRMDIDETAPASLLQSIPNQQTSSRNESRYTNIIKTSILRLIDNDNQTIVAALKQEFSQQLLFSLVGWLRLEMSRQGWFLQVLQEDAYTIVDNEEQQTMTRLVKIFSCVLDTLGMAPWLNTAESAEAENVVAWMKLEISAALEAVEEATYMSGILHEIGLFTKHIRPDERFSQGSRRIEPVTVDDGLMGNNALPTSLKPAGYIDVNVIKAGKEQKMSSRQIGHMKSKMVGAYSREFVDLNDSSRRLMGSVKKRKM